MIKVKIKNFKVKKSIVKFFFLKIKNFTLKCLFTRVYEEIAKHEKQKRERNFK